MERCLELARLGTGNCAPNPMVGAVLVNNDRIIGEGWHEEFGAPHAEVNCLASVRDSDKHLITSSELYVSLEPCAHFGKTPPCADLIIENKIPSVIVACRDPFPNVNGKGIEKIKKAGIQVEEGLLETEAKDVNKRFFCFHQHRRPYVILKWAETTDGFIADLSGKRLMISNEYSNRLVHKWRSAEASILIGTNTALADNPELTNRSWNGRSPIRLVVDMELKLPSSLKIFNGSTRTIVFNSLKHEENNQHSYYRFTPGTSLPLQILNTLYKLNILSVIIEGGAKLLQSFIDTDTWDEARVIRNRSKKIKEGLKAPVIPGQPAMVQEELGTDVIEIYKKAN
jgi:diaminohydroxyphosphoribosylaminopyrimidine deaminase / 5-amino-6-(5-phosphoribosylamino)uracil reductase